MKRSIGARTLHLPAPVWVVGTYDADGRPDMMTASWTGICCSEPPCVAVGVRRSRYTYENIVARQAFTICVPSQRHVREVDHFGLVSGREPDKIARSGLTPVASEIVDAPYLAEFPLAMECRLLHSVEIGSHTQFIGEILDVKIDEECIGENGGPDAARLRVFVLLDTYRGIGEVLAQPFASGRDV